MKLLFYKLIAIFLLILIIGEIGFNMLTASDSFVNILGFITIILSLFGIYYVTQLKKLPRLSFRESKR